MTMMTTQHDCSLSSSLKLMMPKRPVKSKRLPNDFVPSKYTVLCGRGRNCTSSSGNQNLRMVVDRYLAQYSQAKNKLEKSIIVSSVINAIQTLSPEGSFVKQDKEGNWWEVDDSFAREKIGCIFRDILHTQYRSSTKAKSARKKERVTPSRYGFSSNDWKHLMQNTSNPCSPFVEAAYTASSDFSIVSDDSSACNANSQDVQSMSSFPQYALREAGEGSSSGSTMLREDPLLARYGGLASTNMMSFGCQNNAHVLSPSASTRPSLDTVTSQKITFQGSRTNEQERWLDSLNDCLSDPIPLVKEVPQSLPSSIIDDIFDIFGLGNINDTFENEEEDFPDDLSGIFDL